MNERWLSVDEIAAHLGVNPNTISKGVTRKGMPAHKVGRLWKFPAREVEILEHGCELRQQRSRTSSRLFNRHGPH
ncbi:MAG: helix-turn-helix domain-containing protein [Verrucomicrobia bacterium]|nr:helix-turn-helix domain-containing protein [Verrucomicrobiota bacterium]